MKIVLNEVTKELEMYKEDGTLLSTFSYKNYFLDDVGVDDLKSDIEKFNVTLRNFNDIKELRTAINVHNWD